MDKDHHSDKTHGSGESQREFLRLFLESERAVRRTVAALIPARDDAEDVVQETALELWEAFDRYDETRPFTAWACGFARFKALQWIERRSRWRLLLEKGLAEEIQIRQESLRASMETRFRRLEWCVEKLPEDRRKLIRGYYYENRKLPDLASWIGCSEAAAYKSLQRIRAALLACIREMGPWEEADA